MAFTTPTNTFKKPPSCLWFCHSNPRNTTSMVTSSSLSSSSCSKPLYRWQVQIPYNKKDRFHNMAMVFSPFVYNTRSNFTTMYFDESQRYLNMPRQQSCVDFRLIVESRRGNSYARMVPRGNHKDGPHGNTYTNTLRKKQDFQKPQTWNQATQALRNIKEDAIFSNKVSVSVPNVQYTEGYEKSPSQSQSQSQSQCQQSGGNFLGPKLFESKQKTSQDTHVNGVHQKDFQSKIYLMDKSQLPSQSQPPNGNFPSKKILNNAHVNGVNQNSGNFPSQSQQPNGNFPSTKLFESNQKILEQQQQRVNGAHRKVFQPKKTFNFVKNGNFSSPKSFEPKQKILEETRGNGAHRKDLQLKNQLVDYDVDFNETYIVPIGTGSSGQLQNKLKSIYKKVLVVDNISVAQEVVKKLTNEYRHLVHACDTEVAEIDVKQETPVDHGKIICFSIYSGHEADFGNGKSCIWVDVLDGGGKNILDIFKPFFEDPFIKKVWHNYSFDNHIIENYGLKLSGFHADTMHMARLWDSSRQMSGGYSLEALTSDTKGIMSGANLGPNEELIGKVSMKTIFGRKKLKKDGTEGKVVIIPPVEELQKEEREPWVCYSALDSISTLKLYERLKSKLSNREWKFDGVTKGNLFDFYEQYWRPFGQLLVKMETEGMLVDRAHLFEKEIEAKEHQKIAADRFRNWASKLCPDAKFMNVGSDTQLRTLFFGGIENSKDPSETLPTEKEFKVPNVDNIIEEGKKTATKFRKIKLKTISPGPLPTETFTASGWPSVSGAVLRTLAGKLSKYDDNLDVTVNENDDDEIEVDDVDDDEDADMDDDVDNAELADTKKEEFVGNSEDVYGTAYQAFGGGFEGHEACHAINALCDVCTIDSLISNFILPLQGSHISGNDGRVHCSLNINTETGRLSARRPNLQNQPALEKDIYKIRKAFIAAPGNSLIVADYGQLELRILAHLANCKSMLDAFKAGGDFHSRTAMNMYPEIREAVDNKQVLLEWDPQPGQEKPPVPLLKDKYASHRRKAKMLNFSIAYGKTAIGLARDWKVSVKEARETVNRWYSDRKEVLKWQDERKKEAREIKCVYTLLGRARTFAYPQNAPPSHRGHIERAAINTPVQGSAADVAMCAMLEISKNARLKELGWKLLLQVHDEVILEGPTESAEVAKAIVVDCMSNPFDGKNILKVGLSVDAKFAQSWYDAK